jgi:hypothetical protein
MLHTWEIKCIQDVNQKSLKVRVHFEEFGINEWLRGLGY